VTGMQGIEELGDWGRRHRAWGMGKRQGFRKELGNLGI